MNTSNHQYKHVQTKYNSFLILFSTNNNVRFAATLEINVYYNETPYHHFSITLLSFSVQYVTVRKTRNTKIDFRFRNDTLILTLVYNKDKPFCGSTLWFLKASTLGIETENFPMAKC